MTLLEEIQAAATSRSHSLSDLLRKCQILAFRLRHEPFKTWINHELNGYPNDATLPPYRGELRGDVKANLVGPFGRSASNVPVPLSLIPEQVREEAVRFRLFQGVATLETIVAEGKASKQTTLQSLFPPELAARLPIWEGYQTLTLWLEIPVALVAGVLDQVRSRALEFVLEIEAANPEAGAASGSDPPVPLARADAIFNTVILGGQVAIGPGATVNVTPGDLDSLLAYLEAQGVAKSDRDQLKRALAADKNKLGPQVKAWLGGMALKATGAGGRIATGAAGGLIATAVARFLGLV